MPEQSIDLQSASGGSGMPPPPAGPPSVPPAPVGSQVTAKGRKPSKKLIIIASAVLLIVVAAIVALFIVKDIMRGGAKSPELAGQQLIESVNTKDVVGLFTMIAPHERDAAMRVQEAVTDKFMEYGIAEALKKIAPEGAYDSESKFTLDGVDVTVSGAAPIVTEIADDFAQVRFTSGEVRTSIDPAKTKGALRSALDAAGEEDVLESNFFVADMGPNQSGLTLLSAKTDGRWYLSPMLSALEFGKVYAEHEVGLVARGTVPDSFPKGSESPEAAAGAAVRNAVVAFNDAEPAALAPSLVKAEAAAFYLYADLWKLDEVSGERPILALGDATFAKGATDGNRAHAIVQSVSLEATDEFEPSGDRVFFSDSCISGTSMDKECLNGSGYALDYSEPTVNPMAFFTVGGKFGLTTVKEDGAWKVSVLDTAADMAISWVNSLTKEQSLALLRLEQTDKPGGALTVGATADLDFNSAGYAVRTLTVKEAQNVSLDGEGEDISMRLYEADLETEIDSNYDSGTAYFGLEAGSYTAVFRASDGWQEKFADAGNKVKYASSVTASSYVVPPKIEGSNRLFEGYLSLSNGGMQSVELAIPKGTAQQLIMSGVRSNSFKDYVVDVGGKQQVVPVGPDARHVIALPAGTESVTMTVEVGTQVDNNVAMPLAHGGSTAWYDLEFVDP